MAFLVSGLAIYKSLGLAAFLGYMLVAAVLSVIAEEVWRK
jgi:quinol-cytochrome oxidoreductase complex cytochrome b subunit